MLMSELTDYERPPLASVVHRSYRHTSSWHSIPHPRLPRERVPASSLTPRHNNSLITLINKRKLLRCDNYKQSIIKHTCAWLIKTYARVLITRHKSSFAFNCGRLVPCTAAERTPHLTLLLARVAACLQTHATQTGNQRTVSLPLVSFSHGFPRGFGWWRRSSR